MEKVKNSFRVYKKTLDNGLNVLVRPVHSIPEVAVQLWYNVGSKDEEPGQLGMAHLIEHMMFKGTKKLSEPDIDLITMKLSGYANAFTSNDYTTYVFKLPSNVWVESLDILSDCMQNARFDAEMLNSELHAVIQELKLYRDEYQDVVMERMVAGIFHGHPYQHPIIGYKQNLLSLDRDNLYAFYKKHYHPSNATLVIAGDVTIDDAFEGAQKYFGKILSPKGYEKKKHFFSDDLCTTMVRVPREVENPWVYYAYPIPGISAEQAYLFDMVKTLLGRGRSSRLHERLVNQAKIATSAGCSALDLFEKGLFYIYVQPVSLDMLPRIESLIDEEIRSVVEVGIEDWEFHAVKKKTEMGYLSLLESVERQAELIGYSFLATGSTDYLDSYMDKVRKVRRTELQHTIKTYLVPEFRHTGLLVPANDEEKRILHEGQVKADEADFEIMKKRARTTPLEEPKGLIKVEEKELPDFKYPAPQTFILDNGLEVIYHHSPMLPKISALLGFKASHLDEPESLSGMSTFVSRLLLEGTKKYNVTELNRYLDSEGIYISSGSGGISLEMTSEDFPKGLEILHHIVTEPAFTSESMDKIRQQMIMELDEYWDTPFMFVDSLARDIIYKGHPYSKFPLGRKECIARFTQDQCFDFAKETISPQETVLVIVGDLSLYKEEALKRVITKALGGWKGKSIPTLFFPEISYSEPKVMHHAINRDQVVLAFAAPSIARLDSSYDALSILDFILTGAGVSATSRLYQLREETGLFYTIGGSLVYGSGRAPGMNFIKTLVSMDKVSQAEKSIRKTVKILEQQGINEMELIVASRALTTASVRVFEENSQVAKTFLFLKRCGVDLDLFDKRGALLSILKVGEVNSIAHRYCRESSLSTIRVGRESV